MSMPSDIRLIGLTDETIAARDRLFKKIATVRDLPTLGRSVSRVIQLASSDSDAVGNLAYFVLSDVALTQKMLRLANSVNYRMALSAPITTVSKAIFLLGFDTVKTIALAMLLIDQMPSQHAACLRKELAHALSASVVGRELARRSFFKDAEEAAIAALFKNIGRVLVAAHDHLLYNEIVALTANGTRTQTEASLHVLGCSFEQLADSVLRAWQIPDSIIHALAPLPGGVLRAPKTRHEWLQQVAAFSSATATLIPHMNEPGQDVASRALLARFGAAFNLDAEKLADLLQVVADEAFFLTDNTGLTDQEHALISESQKADRALEFDVPCLDEEDAHQCAAFLPSDLLMPTPSPDHLLVTQRHPSGKPLNCRDLLLAGLQDVTNMLSSERCAINELMMLVLETLHRSMGCRFTTICLKDGKTGEFRACMSLGEGSATYQAGFFFSAKSARDLFCLATGNDVDLMIADASNTKIHDLIPAWHAALLPDTHSFILLPLVVNKKPLGLLYADRILPAPEGVPSDEATLIRLLKGQLLTALQR
jgi:HD-like signal output (HDOD) protein